MNFASSPRWPAKERPWPQLPRPKPRTWRRRPQTPPARARQQALEAAGVADKTDDDDTLPELRCEPHTRRFYFSERYTSHWPVGCSAGFFFSHLCPLALFRARRAHQRVDKHLRQLYKHTDSYLRAVNAMTEASKALADDFADALDSYPALRTAADQLCDGRHAALAEQMQILGQMLHRRVFTPIRKEVEGRKDLEKRINDRKKVRLDYDAYRRKQEHLLQNDPGNRQVYEANLENAKATFTKHSNLVASDLSAVAAERDQALTESFMAYAVAEAEFHSQLGKTFGQTASQCGSGFEASPATADSWKSVNAMHGSIKQQVKSSPPPQRSKPQREEREATTQPSQPPSSKPSQPPQGMRSSPPARSSPNEYVPPDLEGFGAGGSAPQKAKPAPPKPPPKPPQQQPDMDLLGGAFASPPPPPLRSRKATARLHLT